MQLLKHIFILSALSIFSTIGFSQSISGPSSANLNETKSYSFTNGFMLRDASWEALGGTILSTSQNGTTYAVDVKWTLASSNDKIRIKDGASIVAEKTVNVLAPPLSGGTISGNQTICSGSTPSTLANVSLASGGGLGKYQYQWQQKSGSTWSDISGAIYTSYSPPAQTSTKDFRRKVTKLSYTAYSNTVTVTVIGTVSGGTISGSQTICYNGNPSAFTSSSSNANYSYQWQTRTPGGSWSNISGATSTTYDQGALTSTKEFRRRATACSQTAYSNTLTVTVYAQLTAGSVSGNQTICYNTAPSQLMSTALPTGGNGSYDYRWQERSPGGSWANAHAINSLPNLSPSSLTSDKEYRRRVTSCSETKYSNVITVNVYDPLNAGSISAATQVCYGSSTTISNAQSATGGNGITYSWQKYSGGWITISGSSSSVTLTNLTGSASYRRVATSCGQTAYTNLVIIEVLPSLSGGIISGSQTICYNGDPSAFTNGAGASGGDNNYSYQWQTRTPGGSWSNISGATSTTYNQGALTTTKEYRRKVTSCSQTAYSNTLTITVNPQLSAGSIGGAQAICSGETPSALTNTASASGGNGAYTYQWQQKPTGGSWTNTSGSSTSASYSPSALTETTEYRRKASSCGQDKYSNTIVVTVNSLPLVTSSDFNIFDDNSFALTGGSPSGGTWSGSYVASGNFDAATAGSGIHSVQYAYTEPATGCSNSTTSNVSVQTIPVLNNNSNVRISQGTSTTLSIGGGFQAYQWYKDNVVMNGATASSVLVTDEGMYSVDVSTSNDTHRTNEIAVDVINASLDQNFVLSRTFLMGQTDDTTIPDSEILEQTAYFDGLGRPMQTVQIGQSPEGNDLVQPIVYDEFGREGKQYLPYATNEAKGTYRSNAVDPITYANSDQYSFYNTASDGIVDDTAPYAQKTFELSPLNRVLEEYGPGQDWITNTRRTQFSYEANTTADHVISWEVDPSNGNRVVKASPNEYTENELFKNVTTDEEGHEVQEFTNKLDQTVLKRVEAPTGWADTYYVYDDFGNLRFVLPPEASARYGSEYGSDKDGFLARWAFRYKYDEHKRMVEKQVPGAGVVYMVYDSHYRLVLTQDANQREDSLWLFTKYDTLNRPVATGTYKDITRILRTDMQTYVSHAVGVGFNWCETVSTGAGNVHGYTNLAFPDLSDTNAYLTVTYYDDYSIPDTWTGYGYSNASLSMTTNDTYTIPTSENQNVKGQVTGSQVKNLGDNTWLKTVTYYDDKYRVIQTVADNQLGGVERMSSLYDFTGKVLQIKAVHGDGTTTHTTLQTNTYDHAGRLLKAYYQLDGGDNVLLSSNAYNELGELIEKDLHSTDETNFAQSVDYDYNIRGWLTSINDPTLSDGESDYFGMELMYNMEDGVGNTGLYNGNISAVKWTSGMEGSQEQAYTYTYDPMNRLTAANSKKKTGTWLAGNTNVTIGAYDLNGNIESLTRYSAGGTMDNLTYNYNGGGNQLQFVSDAGLATEGFKDGNTSGNDYNYDGNGNMTEDKNKDIATIAYNHLNLPRKVIKDNGDSLVYIYDAAGIKLAQIVYDSLGVEQKRTDYVGAYVYENDTLRFIQTPEGRIVPGTTSEYQYYLKDHLGNTRVTFTTKDETDTYLATMETEYATYEEKTFSNVAETRKLDQLYNHTPADGTVASPDNSAMLNSTLSKWIGPAKSLRVAPGDTVSLEVYAQFASYSGDGSKVLSNTLLGAIAGAFTPLNASAEVTQQILNQFTLAGAGSLSPAANTDAPAAYLNYLLFDNNFELTQTGFAKISTSAEGAFEQLALNNIAITEAGYLYIYVSNEDASNVNVYFDDLKVEHVKSRIIQMEDYYPFGLTFNSYQRPNTTEQNYQYNGKELQDELDVNWLDYGARMYMADIGRWGVVDPMAEKYMSLTPYNYVEGNPMNRIDPDGMESSGIQDLIAKVWAQGTGVYNNKGEKQEKPSNQIDEILKEHGVYKTRQQMLLPKWKDYRDVAIAILEVWVSPSGKGKVLSKEEKILELISASGDIALLVNMADNTYDKQTLSDYSLARLDDLNDYYGILQGIYKDVNGQLEETQKAYDNLPISADKPANAENLKHYGKQLYKLSDKLGVVTREMNSIKILINAREKESRIQH